MWVQAVWSDGDWIMTSGWQLLNVLGVIAKCARAELLARGHSRPVLV